MLDIIDTYQKGIKCRHTMLMFLTFRFVDNLHEPLSHCRPIYDKRSLDLLSTIYCNDFFLLEHDDTEQDVTCSDDIFR